MGSINQLLFVKRHASELAGPFLEVGSKDYGNTQDLRSVFRGRGEYVGADIEAGPGVDVVLDFTRPFAEVDNQLAGRRFGTIFCLSVMEHCTQPFAMADNLTQLLLPGGKLCIAVPFAFQFHAYPSDYWRFTHEGIKILFPRLQFDLQKWHGGNFQNGRVQTAGQGTRTNQLRLKMAPPPRTFLAGCGGENAGLAGANRHLALVGRLSLRDVAHGSDDDWNCWVKRKNNTRRSIAYRQVYNPNVYYFYSSNAARMSSGSTSSTSSTLPRRLGRTKRSLPC